MIFLQKKIVLECEDVWIISLIDREIFVMNHILCEGAKKKEFALKNYLINLKGRICHSDFSLFTKSNNIKINNGFHEKVLNRIRL